MPRASNGVYTLPSATFQPRTPISSSAVNANFSDIATALTQSIATTGVTNITAPLHFVSGTAGAPGIGFAAEVTTGFFWKTTGDIAVTLSGQEAFGFRAPSAALGSGLTGLGGAVIRPVGEIAVCASVTGTPDVGWAICNGQPLNRLAYPELFAKIGSLYGDGDHSTTFNVPDLRGRVIAADDANTLRLVISPGVSAAQGQSLGENTHTLNTTEMPAHAHGVNYSDPNHTHSLAGITQAAHLHSITLGDPQHTHVAAVDKDHQHIFNPSAFDPGHSHGVIDIGHTHGLTMNAHTHGTTISESAHTHGYQQPGSSISVQTGGTPVAGPQGASTTAGATTAGPGPGMVVTVGATTSTGTVAGAGSGVTGTTGAGSALNPGATSGVIPPQIGIAVNPSLTGMGGTFQTDGQQPTISGSVASSSSNINITGTTVSGSGGAHNNVQPTMVIQYMIFKGRA